MNAVVMDPPKSATTAKRRELRFSRPGNMTLKLADFSTDKSYLCASLHHSAAPNEAIVRVVSPQSRCHTESTPEHASLHMDEASFDLHWWEVDLIHGLFTELERE